MPVLVASSVFLSLLSALVFIPLLTVLFGAFGGYIVQLVIGDTVVQGLALLGLNVPQDKLWVLAAGLAFVGGYFRSLNENNCGKN